MQLWYPNANTSAPGNHAGNYVGGYNYKGVLHTTEGSSAAGAISAYTTNNSWPHFTVDRDGTVYQHLQLDKAARSLKNLSGGVETNRGKAIQIEVVGFASEAGNWPGMEISALKALMRWIEAQTGITQSGPGRPFASAYGQHDLRLSNQEWKSFGAWLGHCHTPEQKHWDPGAIVISNLFGSTLPSSYFEEDLMPFTVPRNQGGYVVVGTDGGVFAYGAPFHGSLPGIGVSAIVVGADWTPDGGGYWLMSNDGAIYSFGNAQYRGGFNALPPSVRGNRVPIGLVTYSTGYKIITMDPSGDNSPFDLYTFT